MKLVQCIDLGLDVIFERYVISDIDAVEGFSLFAVKLCSLSLKKCRSLLYLCIG